MTQDKQTKIYAEVLENEALEQFYKAMSLPCNIQGALMPDAHAGYTLPIGAVVKSENKVFPSYVGYDIGCGMCAVRTDVDTKEVNENILMELKDKIVNVIPLGMNKHTKLQKIPKEIASMDMTDFAKDILNHTGVYQIGTLGGGNHFIEIGKDNDGMLNIVIHSGSRGVGYKIADYYMKEACIKDVDEQRYIDEFDNKNIDWKKKIDETSDDSMSEKYLKARQDFVYRRTRARVKTNTEGHFGFDLNSDAGKNYVKDMDMALDFALANRQDMINKIIKSMEDVLNRKIKTDRFINRNHNHAEIKDGFAIHRKGATHAEKDMMGVIPGNMKDGSFIVNGKGNEDSMCSSSHGAGRVLSRRKAKDTLDVNDFHDDMKGIVTNHTDTTVDESPRAYKNIFEVMELQNDLVEVVDYIKPILNIKG